MSGMEGAKYSGGASEWGSQNGKKIRSGVYLGSQVYKCCNFMVLGAITMKFGMMKHKKMFSRIVKQF